MPGTVQLNEVLTATYVRPQKQRVIAAHCTIYQGAHSPIATIQVTVHAKKRYKSAKNFFEISPDSVLFIL